MDSDVNPFFPHGELNDGEIRILAVVIDYSMDVEWPPEFPDSFFPWNGPTDFPSVRDTSQSCTTATVLANPARMSSLTG